MNNRVLKAKMYECGYNDQKIAEAIGIDVSTFYRKKSGLSDFTREEIKRIKDTLDLSLDDVDRIFFGE